MNLYNHLICSYRYYGFWLAGLIVFGLGACSSSSNAPTATPPPPAAVNISGVVTDGPVIGGTIFVFGGDQVLAAMAGIDPAGDRLADLTAADSIVTLTRDPADGDQFSISIPGEFAETARRPQGPGIGLIVEIDVATGDRVELAEFTGVGQ